MMTVEEKCFKSVKADASLYNGRPTDTGAQCHSVGAASNTPSIRKDKDGVSVKNFHTSLEEVDTMLHDKNVNSIDSRPLLSYYYGHTSYRQDNSESNPPLIIRDEAMDTFIKLTSVKNPHIVPVTSQNIQYNLGDHVIVTEGDFEGIQGRVARIAGQQRVIVELFSGCLVATAYIPKEAMRKVIDI